MKLQKRVAHPMVEIVNKVRKELETECGISQQQIDAYIRDVNRQIEQNKIAFPIGSMLVPINLLWIDYQIQRDVILRHIASIIKRFDTRIVSPASSCTESFDYKPEIVLPGYLFEAGPESAQQHPIFVYDGQHRIVVCALLGFTSVPIIIVPTDDPSFPSYAFEECNTSTASLGPQDKHRNRLVRWELGNRDPEVKVAYYAQKAFDDHGIDFEDKNTRKSKERRGDQKHFFSHFDYATKCASLSVEVINDILKAITTVYPNDEEVSQDLFAGLWELARKDLEYPELKQLDPDWMIDVLLKVKQNFPTSLTAKNTSLFKEKIKEQLCYITGIDNPTWNATQYNSIFLKDMYQLNGGKLPLPLPQKETLHLANDPVDGFFPKEV